MDEIDESLQRITFEDTDSPIDVTSDSSEDDGRQGQGELEGAALDAPKTPVKTRRQEEYFHQKHALTPESKLSAEPKPKRIAKQSSISSLSSKQCHDRRVLLIEDLRKFVTHQDDPSSFVKQLELLELLDLADGDKNLLTRCVKAAFPHTTKSTIENEVVYTKLSMHSDLSSACTSVVKELFTKSNRDLVEIQQQIAEMEPHLLHQWEMVVDSLGEGNAHDVNLAALKYQRDLEHYFKLNSAMIKLYENDIDNLTTKTAHLEGKVSASQEEQLIKEVKELEQMCSFGLKSDGDIDYAIHDKIFQRLLGNVEEKCPLLHNILETLLVCVSDKRKRVHKTLEYKMKCGSNALALLLSVRSQKISNDIRLMFGLLCISYGAGKQFVNLLHKIGLSPHWDTINNFLDCRLDQLKSSVAEKCSDSMPVILLMDNINMYRGNKRHDRLFKEVGPKMWNFTGRAAVIPDLSGIEELMSCEENVTQPQIDIASLKADDLFLDSMPEYKVMWDKWCDRYYLELLDKTLNCIHNPPKPFTEMNETELNNWLRSCDFECVNNQGKYKLNIPPVDEFCRKRQATEKTDVINLSLSLEDNSTLTGTASILEEFSEEFGIPSNKENIQYIEFNRNRKAYDIKAARERCSFMKSVQLHHVQMIEVEKQLISVEKEIDQPGQSLDIDSETDGSDIDESTERDSRRGTGTSIRTEKEIDRAFSNLYKSLVNEAQETIDSNDDSSLDKLVKKRSQDSKKLNSMKDRYGRTIFHVAVEEKQKTLVHILLAIGINPNAREDCGATPLSIAVLNADHAMCKLLLENFAQCQGGVFNDFPSPMEMAVAMELNDIVDLFNNFSTILESSLVMLIQGNDTDDSMPEVPDVLGDDMTDDSNKFTYERSKCRGFPTAIVGDVGTCKNNRGVRNRNINAYGWSTEIPGDMHAKGFLCEAAFKAHGTGGFHRVVNTVMKRSKLTKEVFKKRKFQEQNLNRIKESVRDGSQSYGMAAVNEFLASPLFPTHDDLKITLAKYGSHNKLLLGCFKKWLEESATVDECHRYHQQLFTLFGPLLELFIAAGKQGDGELREIVWVMLLPIFSQLQFRNYWTEAFVHVVNFSALWPLAFREMMKYNSTVNLGGKAGHNLDMDEYVETYIVRPLKTYATGHTSVQMCRRLMGNLNMLSSTRSAYTNKLAFDHHPTTKHKEQSPFPDQLKGMWFCLRNGFFKATSGRIPLQYPLQGVPDVQKPVPKMFWQVKEKGEKKVKEKFEEKLHDSFPAFRKYSFEKVVSSSDD